MRGAPRANAAAKDSDWVRARQALEAAKPPDVNEILLMTPEGELLEVGARGREAFFFGGRGGGGRAVFWERGRGRGPPPLSPAQKSHASNIIGSNRLLLVLSSFPPQGMSSNFAAVMDGTVYTAEEGVLAGSVRNAMLAVCRREGIPVVLRPPRAAEAPRWAGALVCSTSRLVLPVDRLALPSAALAADGAAAAGGGAAAASGGGGGGGGKEAGDVVLRFAADEPLTRRIEALVLAEIGSRSGLVE